MLIQLPNAFGDAATNMAIDTALLATLPEQIAVFRHYGWTEPAVTFGYAQSFDAVQAAVANAAQLTLCRRSTGGGIVDHRDDWTYACIIQTALPAAHIPATLFYQGLHRSLQRALAQQSIPSVLAPCPRHCDSAPAQASQSPDQCFVRPAADDVLRADGRKIAGAALKRSRAGLLVQGSIDRASLPPEFDFARLAQDFLPELAAACEIPIGHSEDLRALFDGARIATERTRFASSAWNRKR